MERDTTDTVVSRPFYNVTQEPPAMVRMVSNEKHQYDGRWLEAGEVFYAEEKFVQVLIAMGRASRHPEGEGEDLGRKVMPDAKPAGYNDRNLRLSPRRRDGGPT